ncbi:MAG: CRISPR-associated DxTHG motif protein, partial [Thermoproteus sp.]
MNRTLYLATWGNPLEWQEVEYECGEGERKKGFASAVCADADRYVIHVLDSVIAASGGGAGRPVNKAAIEAAREAGLEQREDGGRVSIAPPDCEGWRDYVERYVRGLAARAGIEESRTAVVATAAVGRLGGRTYGGTPDLMLSELLYGLWHQVGRLGEPEGQLRLVVDVTHGVNFMPAVALWAARLAASLALAAGYERAVVQAYNATPGNWQYVKVYSEEVTHLQFPRLPARRAARA